VVECEEGRIKYKVKDLVLELELARFDLGVIEKIVYN